MKTRELETIEGVVMRAHPTAIVRIDREIDRLDVSVGGRAFVVNFFARWGYCIDELRAFEHPFDNSYRFVEPTPRGAAARLLELIEHR